MQDGMFLDGVFYAAIARNLAMGMGSWWDLHYSFGMFDHFHQQPPLMIWLQSFFFRINSNSIYPERIYCIAVGLLMLFILGFFWKTLNPDDKNCFWLPQLLFLSVPTISWGLRNNVIENTMIIFDFLSVMFMISLFEKNNVLINFLLAIVFLFAASLTKGFPGLFPLAAPACYWISTRNISIKRMALISVSLIASIFLLYFILMMNPSIRKSFQDYLTSRLTGFPHTPYANATNRFWILSRLFIEMSLPVTIGLIIVLAAQRKNLLASLSPHQKSMSLFFFLVGSSASIPLMTSFEQRGFYLITSIPYFIISISIIVIPFLKILLSRVKAVKASIFQIGIGLFLISGIAFTLLNAGKAGRDQDQLQDVYILRSIIGSNQIVGASSSALNDWALQAYLVRYANISLTSNNDSSNFFVQKKSDAAFISSSYESLDAPLKSMQVYKRK